MSFWRGVKAYGKAIRILFSRKFAWFLLFPVLALFLLFMGGNILITYISNSIFDWIGPVLTGWVEGISWLQWVSGATGFLINVLLRIIYFIIFLAVGGYGVLIVMSPVYSWLSERTEAHLSGKKYPFSLRQMTWEIFRGIIIALRNMILQLLLSGLFFLCAFIPLVGFLAPFAMFLTSSYFYGFSFVDYAIERKHYNIKQSVKYINKNTGLVIGIGSVFALSLLIPWIKIAVCCFVSLLSVIAAAVAVHEEEKSRSNKLTIN